MIVFSRLLKWSLDRNIVPLYMFSYQRSDAPPGKGECEMFDYEIISVSRYDGTSAKEPAVEVFNTVTGTTIAVVRRRYMEAKKVWIDRAMETARMAVA
jgi:hypothetical protein